MRSSLVRGFMLCLVANGCAAATLCAVDEQVVFSCAVARARIVSVCRAPRAGQGEGALAYRFGRPGRPELVFPSAPDGSFAQFRFAHYFRSQVDRSELNFTIAGTEYSVYDDFEGEEQPAWLRGVRVTTSSKTVDWPCIGTVVSKLPQLESLVPCDVDNALGGCR